MPNLHDVPLPDERNAALAYYETYYQTVTARRASHPDLFARLPPPYLRRDYINFITHIFGERKEPRLRMGRKSSTSRTDVDVLGK